MNKSHDLNVRFGIEDSVIFKEGPGDLMFIEVHTPMADARLSLQGAQVLSWTPINERPVIWISADAMYLPNKSVRGGIPICWPWFGPHATQADFPAHGVARTSPWMVKSVEQVYDQAVRLVFTLPQTVETGAYWPFVTPLQYSVTVGSSLELELITRNDSENHIVVGEAFHTYFAVSDVRNVRVLGLEGYDYIDKVDGGKRKQQSRDITISGEVDRVYLHTDADCVIEDKDWQRRIHIQKLGSLSTIVWNPWIEKSARLGDLGENGYLHMLCVESGNAADNIVRIPAGEDHTLGVKYRISHDV
jgi:glucose-6-phosphate 1-epimerase